MLGRPHKWDQNFHDVCVVICTSFKITLLNTTNHFSISPIHKLVNWSYNNTIGKWDGDMIIYINTYNYLAFQTISGQLFESKY